MCFKLDKSVPIVKVRNAFVTMLREKQAEKANGGLDPQTLHHIVILCYV